MKFNPVKVVHVYYTPLEDKIFVGRLALNNRRKSTEKYKAILSFVP